MIVGTAYANRGFLEDANDGGIGQYLGASPLTAPWPGLGLGETVVQSSAVGQISDAIVRFYQETGAPGATKGTAYGTNPNKLTHNGATTIWTGTGYTVALNAPVAIGDYVRIDDNGVNVLHTQVVGFEAISGDLKVLVLKDNIPAALRGVGIYFNVSIGQIALLNLTNAQLTKTSSNVTIPSGLTAATSRTGSAYPVIGATLVDGRVLGAAAVSYKAIQTGSFTNVVETVRTEADVAALFPSYTNPESGLGFAAYVGLSPVVLGLDPAPVRVIAPAGELLADFTTTADLIRFRPDYSTVAVLSEDASVIALFKQLVVDRKANDLPTQLFIGKDFPTNIEIGDSTIAVIDDSQTPGQQRTVSVASGSPFATAIPGDTVRHYTSPTVYNSYVIATAISAQTVTLTSSVPGGPLSGQTIEVWHQQSVTERVASIISEAQALADASVNLIFPGNCQFNGTDVPATVLGAYFAALRSYTAPQQSLAYVRPLDGFTGPDLTPYAGYLDDLASGGVFVLDVSSLNQLFVRYPRTTDPSSVATANEIIVATEQFCSRYIAKVLTPYLGLYRTSRELYARLRTEAAASISALRNTSIEGIGPIIIGGSVGTITRSPSNANVVIVPITLRVAGIAEDILQLSITVTLE